jgi:hypothetical protein
VTAFRLISLPVHAAFEMALGLSLMALPFVLGLGPAGVVAGVLLGALIVGLAAAGGESEGRGTVPIGAHAVYDLGLGLGLVGGGLLFQTAGDSAAAMVFAAAGAALLALSLITRYTPVRI